MRGGGGAEFAVVVYVREQRHKYGLASQAADVAACQRKISEFSSAQ